MSVLVLKEWRAENTPLDEDGHLIRISGRKGGFISWFLARVGIDPTTFFYASVDRLEIISSSLSGKEHRIIPLWSVSSAAYGYYKPWKQAYILFILLCLLSGFVANMTAAYRGEINLPVLYLGILVGLFISLLFYVLSRTFTLSFTEHSGNTSTIRFKSSVIEGVAVNEDEALYVCDLVQALIDRKYTASGATDHAGSAA